MEYPTTRNPKLYFSIDEKREFSYADLYEDHFQSQGLSLLSSESSSPGKSLLELIYKPEKRTIKYPFQRFKKPLKDSTSDDEKEYYYDSTDEFIDDSEQTRQLPFRENDYTNALKLGWYVTEPQAEAEAEAKEEEGKTPKAHKWKRDFTIDINGIPGNIKGILEDLMNVYMVGNEKAAFPKGSVPLLLKLGLELEENPGADREPIYTLVSGISGVRYDSIRKCIQKQLLKHNIDKKHKALKEAVSKTDNISHIQSDLMPILKEYVKLSNIYTQNYIRKSPVYLDFDEEARKLLGESLSAFKEENLSMPSKSAVFTEMPVFNPEDFKDNFT